MLYYFSVLTAVTGIHNEKYQFKMKFVMLKQLLKKLCHKHGILTAGYTYGNSVVFFNKLILIYGLCKFRKQNLMEFLSYALFDIFESFLVVVLG